MHSLWEKLEWKEKLWLVGVYALSLLLIFLIGYNSGAQGDHPTGRIHAVGEHGNPILAIPMRPRHSEPTPSSAPVPKRLIIVCESGKADQTDGACCRRG
jgi:hypothetical protein